MFNKSELRLIDESYFIILKVNSFCVTLRSKNTGHYWHIILQEYGRVRRFELWHRHGSEGEYHLHGHAGTIKRILMSIKQHDAFQLNGRRW